MYFGEAVTSWVCEKMNETQCICDDGDKAVQLSVVEEIALFRKVVRTRCDNEKLVERSNDLVGELGDC